MSRKKYLAVTGRWAVTTRGKVMHWPADRETLVSQCHGRRLDRHRTERLLVDQDLASTTRGLPLCEECCALWELNVPKSVRGHDLGWRSRFSQGLTLNVEDRATLERVASILGSAVTSRD